MKMDKRKLQLGSYSVLITVAAIVAVILLNLAVSALDSIVGLSIDLTEEKMYTLSEETKATVAKVETPTVLYYVDSSVSMSQSIRNFLKQYSLANPLITVDAFDPATRPAFMEQFDTDGTGVQNGSIIVATQDNEKFRILSVNQDLIDPSSSGKNYFIGQSVITSAIMHLTDEATYRAWFVTGHGEADLDNVAVFNLAKRLKQENYIVESMDLVKDGNKLQPNDVLIMLGARTDISDPERETLKNFLENEGRLLITARPMEQRLENLYSLLEYFDLSIKQNMIYETNPRQYWNRANEPLANGGNDTESTGYNIAYDASYGYALSILPNCAEVSYVNNNKYGDKFEEVFRVSPEAFLRTDLSITTQSKDDSDTAVGSNGVLAGVYYVHETYIKDQVVDQTRILLLGSTDFAADSNYSQLRVNKNMFARAVYMLAGRTEEMDLTAPSMSDTTLNLTNAETTRAIIISVIVIIPAIILITGLLIWRRRRYM